MDPCARQMWCILRRHRFETCLNGAPPEPARKAGDAKYHAKEWATIIVAYQRMRLGFFYGVEDGLHGTRGQYLSKHSLVAVPRSVQHTSMPSHLNSRDEIAALVQELMHAEPGCRPLQTRGARSYVQVRRAGSPEPRCKCGSCHACVENGRWDRIFNEKFADPEYYSERVPKMGSTLSSLCS